MKLRPPPSNALFSSDEVEGTKVYDAEGNEIGSLVHLVIDRLTGKVVYAVVRFGGVLTAGHNQYPLPWSALESGTDLAGYRTSVTEQQILDAPEFSDGSMESRDWEHRVHQHFDASPYWASRPEG